MAIDNEDDIQLGINYNEEGERQALKGIERITTELQKLKKEASATTHDLAEIDKSVVKLQKTLQSATGSAKEFGGAVVSSGKPYTVAGARGQNTKQTTSASNAMQTASNLNMPDYRYMNKLQDEISDTKDLLSHLNQVYKNTAPVNKYLASQDAANSKLLQSNQALSSQIDALSDTSSKVKAVDNAIAQLNTRINSTNSAMSSANTLLANSTQNIQKYTQLVDGEDKALAGLKESVKLVVNEHDRLNSLLKEQVNNQKEQINALKEYKRELNNATKAQKEADKISDAQKKLEILKEQEERLLNAKRYYQSLVAQAKKYSDELVEISGLDLQGWQTVPSTTSQVTSQYDVGARMTAVKTDYEILLKNVEARKQSTQQIMQEAKVSSQSALEQQDLSSAITSTRQQIDLLEDSLNKNRATMQSVSNLSTNLKTNFNTYTKVLGENDKALAELKVSSTTVRDEFEESRKVLKETMTTQRSQITTLKEQEKQLKLNKKAQDALNEAQEKSRMSAQAVRALGGMESGLARATSTINTGYNRSASAMDSSASMVREANNIEEYEAKISKLQEAYTVLDNAISDNNATMKNASAIVDQLNVIYKQYSANLDENDEDAKQLKQSIEALQAEYKLTTDNMKQQNVVLGRRKSHIKGEMLSWKALDDQVKKSNAKIQKDVLDTERELRQAFASTKQGMRDVSMMARSLGSSMTRFITAPLIAAAAQAVKFTADMEMNIKSLEILLGNNEQAAEELYTKVTQYAAKTPYEIPELTVATKQLLAFGSAADDVMDELRMLGDLAQNDSEKLESITSAFGKVQARGVAHMRELNRFIMAGVPIIQTLGKTMNMSSEELFKAVEQGQVTFGAIKQSIEMLTSEGERFHNMSEELSSTVKGRWSTLSDEVNLALKSFAEDYMESILNIINKTISLAEAIQTMSPAQRQVIKNWALMAATFGPLLLAVGKFVMLLRGALDILEKMQITGVALKVAMGQITAAIIAVATIIGVTLYAKIKKTTNEYEKQKGIIESIADSVAKITPAEITAGVLEAKAAELKKQLGSILSVDTIADILLSQPDDAVKAIRNLERDTKAYTKALEDANEQKDYLLMFKQIDESDLGGGNIEVLQALKEQFMDGGHDPIAQTIEQYISAMNSLNEAFEALNKTTKATTSDETVMGWFKKRLGVSKAEVNDVNTLLNLFKFNTEEAITGTLEQFGRFYGIAPELSKTREALGYLTHEIIKGAEEFSPDRFRELVGKAGIKEGSAGYTLLSYLMKPGEEGAKRAAAQFYVLLGSLGKFTAGAIDSYVASAEAKFMQENVVDIFLGGISFEKDPEFIKNRAQAVADAYTAIVDEGISQVLQSNPSKTFAEAMAIVDTENEGLFKNWEQSLNTAKVASSYSELAKMISDYDLQLKNVNATEIEKFNNTVDALFKELEGTEYADLVANDIDKLKQSFSTLEFEEAKKALQDQKNELMLNADALTELTDKQNGYKDAQRDSLNQMRDYIDALRTLQEIANANPQVKYGDSFSSAYDALKSRTNSEGSSTAKMSLFTNIMPPQPKALAERIAFTKAEKEAIASLASQYVQMDDATRQLTESSEGYLNLVGLITQAEWDRATSNAYVDKATEMLIANNISLSEHGKDANEIQIEFWTNLKNSMANTLDDSQIAVFDALIESFQKLIDLDAEEAGTAFESVLKGIREEIDAFGRSASDTRTFESLNKQKELLTAIAEDMGMSFEDVFSQFTGPSMNVDEALKEKFKLVRAILGDFDDYLKNQALEGIKGTVADYQKQVSQLGMTEKEKFMDDFIRQYEEAGIAVDNFTVAVLGNLYDKIEKNKAMEDATEAIEGYNKQIAQLGMSEQAKAIDNLRRQGEASQWTAEKIDEATEALNKYYALQARMEKASARSASVESFDALINQTTMEGLLAGKDSGTQWLMQNAQVLSEYASNNASMTLEDVNNYALAVYKASRAAITLADAQEEVKVKTAEWASELNLLGSSDLEKFIHEMTELGKKAGLVGEELEKFTDDATNYFTGIQENAAQTEFDKVIEDYNKQIYQLDMSEQEKAIDNLRRQGDELDWSPEEINDAIEVLNRYYTLRDKMEKESDSTEALDKVVASYGKQLSMLNSTEYEQAVKSIYSQGIASQWTADQYKEAMDSLNAYYDAVRANKFESMKDSIGKASSKFINPAYWGQRDNIDKAVKDGEITDEQGAQLEKLLNATTATQELYNVLDSIGDIAFDGLVSSMEAIGDAMFKSSDAGKAFKNSLQDIGIAIINALPNLLLQAGLQLIPTPMWYIGLGLIAASGLVAIGKGYMNAKLDSDIEGTTTSGSSITYSAKGNAWSGGNLINVPTMFNANNGLNVGGELGTEAILPLTRTTSGQLGVNASTGTTNVTVPIQVNIVNESGAETEAEVNQTTNSDGTQSVDVIIKKIVKSGMANGEYDRVLSSRYGVKSRGVS